MGEPGAPNACVSVQMRSDESDREERPKTQHTRQFGAGEPSSASGAQFLQFVLARTHTRHNVQRRGILREPYGERTGFRDAAWKATL